MNNVEIHLNDAEMLKYIWAVYIMNVAGENAGCEVPKH